METKSTNPTASLLGSVLAKTVSPDAWIEFKGGLSFRLRFMPKSKFRSLADAATEFIYDKKSKARVPKINAEAYTTAFVKEAVMDWRGVTLRTLSRIAEIDISTYSEAELDAASPFAHKELATLMDMVYDLDSFLNETVGDIATFRPFLEEEAKNSKSSPTTS